MTARAHEHYTDAEAVAMAPEPAYPEPTDEAQVVTHYDLDPDNEAHQELVVDYLRRGRALEAIQRRAQDAMSLRPMGVTEAEAKRAAKHQGDAEAAVRDIAESALLLFKGVTSRAEFEMRVLAHFAREYPNLMKTILRSYVLKLARQVWEAGR